jgi:hypothetical protein
MNKETEIVEYAFDLTDKQSKEFESLLIKIGLYNPFKYNYKFYYVKYKECYRVITPFEGIYAFCSEAPNEKYKSIQLHYITDSRKEHTFNIDNITWAFGSGINNFNLFLNLITPLIRQHKINTLINE